MGNLQTGARGESIAVDHLLRLGYRVLARNARLSRGEIDIVALDPAGPLAVVEVKTRSSHRFGTGAEAITRDKYRRLRRLAGEWVARHPHPGDVRIDVISIHLPDGGPEVTHLKGVIL